MDFPNPGDRELSKGIQEINKINYHDALRYFEKSISYGNEYALLFAGVIYLSGFGLPDRDPPKAVSLFKQAAAEFQNWYAHYLVGVIYTEGDVGIVQSDPYGTTWMTIAAKRGWYDAMAHLGVAFKDCIFPERDKAMFWLRKVVENDDNPNGLIEDGPLHLFGDKKFLLNMNRVKKQVMDSIRTDRSSNLISPVKCFSKNSDTSPYDDVRHIMLWDILSTKKSSNVAVCQLLIASIYLDENQYYRPDYSSGMYWLKKAAKNGSATGCLSIGLLYGRGNGVEQSYTKAMEWFKKAYQIGGNPETIFRIGNLYYHGDGVKRDCKMALFYFKEMADLTNDGEAYDAMGYIYRSGKDGVPQDEDKAYECFAKAAENGVATAATEIGMRYKEGLNVKKDVKKAYAWFEKGALMGCPLAQYGLGTIFFEGGYQGEVDLDRAMKCFIQSENGGFDLAGFMIQEVEKLRQR
ncbi:hypothetical protein HPULCUR_003587 [Helicostylum pulchrum]|uniref:Beta-lactamase n=1 Tax=Helicostylum pulchrum TaxID=562976 RepID=A0ABP9XVW3_9FUNG